MSTSATAASPRRGTSRLGAPDVLLAISSHVLIRALSLTVLFAAAGLTGRSAHHALTRWDAAWYRRIAEDGYGHVHVAADGRLLSDYAFFPLYPALERAVAAVTGLSVVDAGLVVSAVASVVAAAGVYHVGQRLHDGRTGVVLVCLWTCLPVANVLSMAYTEALFTALAAWCLVALLAHRYVAAGVLAALSGLTRPVSVALVVAVVGAAVLRLAQLRRGTPDPRGPRAAREPLLGAVIAPLGLLSYLGFVGWSEGAVLAYFDVTRGWGNYLDGGRAFAGWVAHMLVSREVLLGVLVVVGVALLARAVWHTASHGYPWPIFLFTVTAVLVSFATSHYFGSRPRYLLPVFTLLLWPSVHVARLPTRRVVALLACLSTTSAAYGAFWLFGPGPP